MSLDTILQIGKTLKQSENRMKHFRYALSCPTRDNKMPICLSISVKNDFTFEWEKIDRVPQNQVNNLYYLKYKVSDQDSSSPKYVFGDILYNRKQLLDSTGKPKSLEEKGGNYILEKNAFEAASSVRNEYIKSILKPNGGKLSSNKEKLLKQIETSISNSNIDDIKEKNVCMLLEQYPLLLFWKSFSFNKTKIELCLRYAPIIDKNNINEQNEIINDYVKFVLNNNKGTKLSKQFKDTNAKELSEKDIKLISQYSDHSVFIHFDFETKQWYNLEPIFTNIINCLNRETLTKQYQDLLVPTKSIYRTLCSGNNKNDIQFPQFEFENSYKSFGFFNEEQFDDFLYTRFILDKDHPARRLFQTQIGLFVFPRKIENKNYDVSVYEKFFIDKKDEATLQEGNDMMFSFLDDREHEEITCFDLVFSDISGNVAIDLVEISGIKKSALIDIQKRICAIKNKIATEKKINLGLDNKTTMQIECAFSDLFGNPELEKNKINFKGANKKKEAYPEYRSHLIKVMPLIYTNKYCNDDMLLSNMINKVEYSIRNGSEKEYDYSNYFLLSYDVKLLYSIQNNQINRYMEITQSKSYLLGVRIGKMTKPLKKEIKSFEKTYVGMLTRRIATKDDCISFINDICEKLTIHERIQTSIATEIFSELVSLPTKDYDKEKLAFGFFEGYFKYEPNDSRENFINRLKKVLSDYHENQSLQEESEQLEELIKSLNEQ